LLAPGTAVLPPAYRFYPPAIGPKKRKQLKSGRFLAGMIQDLRCTGFTAEEGASESKNDMQKSHIDIAKLNSRGVISISK
jgi:hypothetical protein